ncbi:MAG: winged helix-turn-helix domain-containing protein [Pseudomonadales bacterium]|nr:winged helix-turn-helix domain-containing protein [Pseudomonadales bacterium]
MANKPSSTPIKIRPRDIGKVRRIALSAQGLTKDAPFGRGISGARKAIAHIGYVQIDTISVVERAHHHVLHSRVPNYQPSMLNKMLKDRSIFEYWSHAAAFLPMQDYRYSLIHREEILKRRQKWFRPKKDKMLRDILHRIETEGPLRSRDLEDTRTSRSGWWDWKPAKRALEQHFFQGDLMVTEREGFQKVYDLTERVIPPEIDTSKPDFRDYANHLVQQQLNCHGLVSRKGITYMRTNPKLKSAVKDQVDSLLEGGHLDEIELPDGRTYLCHAGQLDRSAPRSANKIKILSPFDNIVIQRERLQSVFDFDYLIECYVPEPKRQFGYFTLPLIYQSDFIGRIDCKAHRKTGVLEVRACHLEDGVTASFEALASAFLAALDSFLEFQGCNALHFSHANPKGFGKALRTLAKQKQPGDKQWPITTQNI